MVKAFGIIRNIKDTDFFQKFYLEEVFPVLSKLPGISYITINSVMEIDKVHTHDTSGIRLIIETHFTHEEVINTIFALPEAERVMKLIEEKALGELYLYIGQESNFDFRDIRKSNANNNSNRYIDEAKQDH